MVINKKSYAIIITAFIITFFIIAYFYPVRIIIDFHKNFPTQLMQNLTDKIIAKKVVIGHINCSSQYNCPTASVTVDETTLLKALTIKTLLPIIGITQSIKVNTRIFIN